MENLARLLLDFGRAPGKYPVRLREPRALFDEFDVIAQWALDRLPESLEDRAIDLKAAAVLFIQRACFAPDNTYYQVLGLLPRAYPPEELRTRYRTMIRLAHPDMGVKGLPSNAASLVNRANEVLSNSELRVQYDEQLACQAITRVASPQPFLPETRALAHQRGMAQRLQLFKAQHPKLVRACMLLGLVSIPLAATLLWAAYESSSSRMLIVAAREPAAEPAPAQRHVAESGSPMPTKHLSPQSGTAIKTQPSAAKEPTSSPSTLATAATPSPAEFMPVTATQHGATNQTSFAPHVHEIVATVPAGQPVAVPIATPPPARSIALASAIPSAAQHTADLKPAVVIDSPSLAPIAVAVAMPPSPLPAPAVAPTPQLAAPAQQPELSVWNIDTEGARKYLNELVSKLESPSDARRINAYLKSMKVKGSLLAPVLPYLDDQQNLEVRPSHWTESTKPGVLNAQATVLAKSRTTDTLPPRILRFRIAAEFHGTAEGTVLSMLEIKESN